MSGQGGRAPVEPPPERGSERSWTVGYRVRFDEAGPNGLVRPGILLGYAQDCAWIHSTRLGFDRAWYAARGLVWLVRAVGLELLAPIPSGSDLRVRTEILGFRAASARRRTEIRLAGALAAVVETDWAMTDSAGQPARVPRDLLDRFGASGDHPPPPAPLRLPKARPTADGPGDGGVRVAERIRWSDADPMAHLNNGRALDLVDEALAAVPVGRALLDLVPRRYLVEYRSPLPVGGTCALFLRSEATPPSGVRIEVRDAATGRLGVVATVGPPVGPATGPD